MLNIEKYKDEIIEEYRKNNIKSFNSDLWHIYYKYSNTDKNMYGIDTLLDWLCEDYKEPILTESEREYFKVVFSTYADSIDSISKKLEYKHGHFLQGNLYIEYCGKDGWKDTTVIPYFDSDMFKGLKEDESYTLEELGL